MSKIYNTAFKVGFGFVVFLFVILNIVSFIISFDKCEKLNREFNSVSYCDWGFPTAEIHTLKGSIICGFSIAACGFISGFLTKFIWSRISSQD